MEERRGRTPDRTAPWVPFTPIEWLFAGGSVALSLVALIGLVFAP